MNWILHVVFLSISVHPYPYYYYPRPNVSYTWSQDTQYDYIVGISFFGRPICQGIIVTMHTILTSANPIETLPRYLRFVEIHTVHEQYNQSMIRRASRIFVNQANRIDRYYRLVGYDSHSPIHDIILFKLEKPIRSSKKRGPTYAALPFVKSIYGTLPDAGWMVAGFGYTDREHVRNHTILEITSLPGSVVDCDEWIPRSWGHFICISDDESLHAVPSGGPLFNEDYGNVVFGIGCFHFTRGNESILVFTNLQSYRFGLVGYYANDTEPVTTTTTESVDNSTMETTTESGNATIGNTTEFGNDTSPSLLEYY